MQSFVAKPEKRRLDDDEDDELGFRNVETVDSSDYASSAPTSLMNLQLSKENPEHQGKLTVVEVAKKPHYKKAAVEDDEEDWDAPLPYDYDQFTRDSPQDLMNLQFKKDNKQHQGTLSEMLMIRKPDYKKAEVEEEEEDWDAPTFYNFDQFSRDSPMDLMNIAVYDPNEGRTSVVSVSRSKLQKRSHLGTNDDDEEYGFRDKGAIDETQYAQDAPNLLQLRWVGRSTVGVSTDETDHPDWVKGVISDHSNEADYVADAPHVHDEYTYDPIPQ